MEDRKRKLLFLAVIVISLMVLAAPARGAEWSGAHAGTGGFSISFGSTNWAVYGAAWSNPGWRVDYHVALSGYGDWLWVDGLGQCWRPWVAAGWRPYTHGRWVWTAYGWTWVAYEPWGYFPHHYGNWAFSIHGWVWSPGYHYRPANVTWVHAGAYVGWYACPPPGWSHASRGFHRGYKRGYLHGRHHGYRMGYDHGFWVGWNDARYATYSQWEHLGDDDLWRHAVSATTVRSASPKVSVRVAESAPHRSTLARLGIHLPQRTMERRTVTVGNRAVTVARPNGMEDSIRSNAGRTLERALSREARDAAVTRATPIQKETRSETANGRQTTPTKEARRVDQASPANTANRSRGTSSTTARTAPTEPTRRVGTTSNRAWESSGSRAGDRRTRTSGAINSKSPATRREPKHHVTETAAAKGRPVSDVFRRMNRSVDRSPTRHRSEATPKTERSKSRSEAHAPARSKKSPSTPKSTQISDRSTVDREESSESKKGPTSPRSRGSRQEGVARQPYLSQR